MSTARQKRKPVFDPSALDEDLDDLWPARTAAAAAPQAAPAAEPIATAPATPASAERPSKAALPAVASQPTRDSAAAQALVADAGNETGRRLELLAINPDTLPP